MRRPAARSLALAAATMFGLVAQGGAQLLPNGPDFQVNSYTIGAQQAVAVARGAGEGFVAVWESGGTSRYQVRARRFNRYGAALGTDFRVDTMTLHEASYPVVGAAPGGEFVVVWRTNGSPADYSLGILARRFDADGAPLGGEFQVNEDTTGLEDRPSVAVHADGSFVVAWERKQSTALDYAVRARRFGADGQALGPELEISEADGHHLRPEIAAGPDGAFVVAWYAAEVGPDADGAVLARRFAADGTALGPQLLVNSYTTGLQLFPDTTWTADGGFVVVWTSQGSSGDDADLSAQGQRFDAQGAPAGGEFQVNTYTPGQQGGPVVAADSVGGFVVSWSSWGSPTGETDWGVQAQRFAADGSHVGGQFQVNSLTPYRQSDPELFFDSDGNLLVVWESARSTGTDQDGRSVQARRFDALFRDGAEIGSTGRWTQTLP